MERSMWDATNGGGADGYRVLARKYRPRDFSDLIGQTPMVRTLTNAFETGRIAQAYMLTGVRGVGKTTTARILARALNYETDTVHEPTVDLAAAGEHCAAIMEGRHVDVIEMDAASHTGIDDIREIIEQVRYRPVSARYKVYIVDEVHMLSTQAFNGLLKTLEEPPAHVKFIFATTEIRKVPITVLSRCQRFDLRRIDAGLLVEHFRRIANAEAIAADDLSLSMIARAAEGSVRDGLSLMDQAIAHGGGRIEADSVRAMLGLADRSRIIDLFDHVVRGDVAAALKEFADQYEAGANPPVVLNDLADFTHLVTRLKFAAEAANDPSLTEAERERGSAFAGQLSVPVLSRLWQMLLKGIAETENSNRPYAAAEMVLIRLTHAAHLPAPEVLARRIENEAGDGSASAPDSRQERRPEASPAGHVQAGRMPAETHDGIRADSSAEMHSQPAPSLGSRFSGDAQGLARRVDPEERDEPAPHVPPRRSVVRASDAGHATAIDTLQDVVDLATRNRDIKLKTLLRTCVRPVRIEAGRLEIALTPDAPKTLAGELGVALEKWTGQRFLVTLSREEGAPTIAAMEAEARETLVRDAREDPDVAAILERFPGARITDVRIRADEEPGEDAPEAPAEDDGETD